MAPVTREHGSWVPVVVAYEATAAGGSLGVVGGQVVPRRCRRGR